MIVYRKRLNLNNDFPSSNALVRNPTGDAVRSLYLTNSLIKVILEHNDYTRLRIINAGTKVFTKQEGGRGMEPSFRVLGEGLPVVLPFIDPVTILDGDIAVLKILITTYYPLCAAFGEPFKSAIEARGTCGSDLWRLWCSEISRAWQPCRTFSSWRVGRCHVWIPLSLLC